MARKATISLRHVAVVCVGLVGLLELFHDFGTKSATFAVQSIAAKNKNDNGGDINVMCTQLLERSKDTDGGIEPWRASGGLLWKYRQHCRGAVDVSVAELGNYLSQWYMTRAIASAANVTLQFDSDCRAPVTEWIPHCLQPPETDLDAPASFSWKEACQSVAIQHPHNSPLCSSSGLDHMVSTLRSDLRNRTQAVLSNTPWLAQDLDEAVIHMHTIGRWNNSNNGLVPFHVFTSLIPNTTETIGIIIASYQQYMPGASYDDTELNEAVAMAARNYIQSKLPDARVSIRNNKNVNETVSMTYARMVAANWSFCSSSTFCLYPALATAGESYILQSPLSGRSPGWLDKVSESFENVHYVEGEVIFSRDFPGWNTTEVVNALERNVETIAWANTDPSILCFELMQRANGTEEGHEPWRASGSPLLARSGCDSKTILSLGNYMSQWYMTRAIASAAGVSIQADCRSVVHDWIPLYWEPSKTVMDNRASFSWKEACRNGGELFAHSSAQRGSGLDHMVSAIRSDLRNMTQAILSKNPWLAQDLDEAVIHLRLGDIAREKHGAYGLVPFSVYTSLIPRTIKTIGIITAPYQQDRAFAGGNDVALNEAVTVAARDYIQSKFPDARVSIRNDDVKETMAVTYVRMVAAIWSFCGSSTFCLYPALATAGESYILQSPLYGGSPGWLDKVSESFENVHYMEGEIILSTELHSWSTTKIVGRLQSNRSTDH